MKKVLFVCMLLAISMIQPCPSSAHAQDVESFVRDFYTLYGKESLSSHNNPAFDDAIFRFVCGDTAKRVRLDYDRAVVDVDYYMKSQDVAKEQLENLMVGKSIAVNDNLSLAPVSMSERKEYAPYIVVYVEKTKGGMCISKVEESLGRNRRGDAY